MAQKLIRVASVQNLFNLVDRRDENMVDACTQQGIPFMPYFLLALGKLVLKRLVLDRCDYPQL